MIKFEIYEEQKHNSLASKSEYKLHIFIPGP